MSIYSDTNVVCADLYSRGERTSENGVRTVSRAQVERVVQGWMARENRTMTVGSILSCETDRWSVESTMNADRFLLLQKGF